MYSLNLSFNLLKMILFLVLIVSAAAFNKAGLKAGLQSTEGQLKLFKQFVTDEHASYSPMEQAFRYSHFSIYSFIVSL